MMRVRNGAVYGAAGAVAALLLAGCSQGLDEATQEYCNDLDALKAEASQLEELVAGDAPVEDIGAQAGAVSDAYSTLRASAQDVDQAIADEVDDAYGAYQDQVEQIPTDATLSGAAPLYGDAVESYLDSLAEIANDVGCEDA